MSGSLRQRGHRPDLPALTSLRFIAAFGVLVLHYRDLLGPMPAWLMKGVVGGQYGVTFFFVLSGFVLTYRYGGWFEQGVADARFWRFQRLRIARLYPVYLLGLLLDTPWHVIERVQAGQLSAVGSTYWASWLMNLVGLQAWVPAVPFAMFWNTPAWSISAEFFFYATFPFVCAWLGRRALGGARLIVWMGAVVVGGALLYAAVIYAVTWRIPVGAEAKYILMVYTPALRFSEFLSGCLVGRYFTMMTDGVTVPAVSVWQRHSWRNAMLLIALAAIAARVWMPDYTGPSQWLWLADVSIKYSVFILPFAVVILAVGSGPTCLSPLLERRWLVLLGHASYALYITHWSVTTFLRMGFLGAHGTPAVHVLFLLGTVGCSVLVYRHLEVPARSRLRGEVEKPDSQNPLVPAPINGVPGRA